MRHRLYFTLPDVPSAEQTIRDLLLARIELPRIHCLARRGTPLGKLPEANFLQKADAIQDAGIGIAAGGILGAIIGGLLVPFARSREISDLVHLRYPAALFDGTEPGIPASP